MAQLYELVRRIPEGKVTSYGELGKALPNPVSGLIIGRWMALCPPDVPWWRVVAKDGEIKVWKRDSVLETIQIEKLQFEGHTIQKGKVILTDGNLFLP